ncbi:LytR/AlgR family response regulator transcription factor [candidate division KSB1 bacterium]
MKIKAIIIDDEKPARSRIKRLMSGFDELELIGEAQNGEEGVELIGRLNPDVVFLDIKMPRLSGFEMLKEIDEPPYIIFTTAYDKYALQAFEENTLDYLLKPVSVENFERAVSKVTDVISKKVPVKMDLRKIFQAIERRKNILQRFSVKLGSKIYIIPSDDVCFFHSEDKQTFLNTESKNYIIPFTLKELVERLDPDTFIRVHRADILNLNSIISVHTWFGGKLMVKLKNGKEIVVSRNYVKDFREKINL